ncbi:hypothetical protein [uncultured Treponema sp.]|uniref:hypothetical protein n=1 Tax=uncultured Treponema sp. TaxID=162155 RepID=UPI0025D82B4E|nr:hypothetical protein [uncultured Treponema sp.]
MLSKILKKSDCASCRFCCSFRRQSLWETPLFDREAKERLEKKFPLARFRSVGKNSFTIDLSRNYKTDAPDEEAACPFLDSEKGCVLSEEEKPFDCKIWPLRAVRKSSGGKIFVALTTTCPSVNRLPFSEVQSLVKSALGEKILSYASSHPDIVKDWREKFVEVE